MKRKRTYGTVILASAGLGIFLALNATLGREHHEPPRLHAFTLEPGLIPPGQIRAGGPPKDGIPALTLPDVIPADKAGYLQPDELVVGVTYDNHARAYPLNILTYHEIVNDRLDDLAFAVTYCPLCRSALVFDRRIGSDVIEFGVSGLLWNSNVLMYDRNRPEPLQSLWSQVQMRAVTGPAAELGLRLTLLPSALTTWRQWKTDHPRTTVLSAATGYNRNYERSPYTRYFGHDRLMFPVTQNHPRPAGFANKELMVLVRSGRTEKAYAVQDIARSAAEKGWFEDRLGQQTIRLEYDAEHQTVQVTPADPNQADTLPEPAPTSVEPDRQQQPHLVNDPPFAVAWLYWFALDAMRPEVQIYRPEKEPTGVKKPESR